MSEERIKLPQIKVFQKRNEQQTTLKKCFIALIKRC
jgi:hypothetical protein